jgi:hypothetical protein
MQLDGLQLFVLLGAVYLLECLRWVGRRTLLIRQWPLNRPTVVEAMRVAPQLDRALTIGFPFPPFGSVLECEPFPFEVGPSGFLVRAPDAIPGEVPTQLDLWVPWAEVGALKVEGKELFLGSRRIAVLHSTRAALRVHSCCRRWASELPRTLPGWDDARDVEALRAALARWDEWRWLQQLTASGLWVAIFAGFSALTFATEPPPILGVFGFVVAWWLICVVTTALWIRQVLPRDAWPGRWQWFITLASPVSLLRAADLVERELLWGADPATAVVATVPSQVARDTLEQWRRELRWRVRRPALASTDSTVLSNDAWYVEALLGRLGQLVDGLGGTAAKTGTGKHCPRCLTGYQDTATACSECPGVALVGQR